jgi:hypothetical protein
MKTKFNRISLPRKIYALQLQHNTLDHECTTESDRIICQEGEIHYCQIHRRNTTNNASIETSRNGSDGMRFRRKWLSFLLLLALLSRFLRSSECLVKVGEGLLGLLFFCDFFVSKKCREISSIYHQEVSIRFYKNSVLTLFITSKYTDWRDSTKFRRRKYYSKIKILSQKYYKKVNLTIEHLSGIRTSFKCWCSTIPRINFIAPASDIWLPSNIYSVRSGERFGFLFFCSKNMYFILGEVWGGEFFADFFRKWFVQIFVLYRVVSR